jgi:hypothetical protein
MRVIPDCISLILTNSTVFVTFATVPNFNILRKSYQMNGQRDQNQHKDIFKDESPSKTPDYRTRFKPGMTDFRSVLKRIDQRLFHSAHQDIGNVTAYLIPCIVLLFYRYIIDAHILDDAYITFKVALNAAAGNGLVFNTHQKVYVVTCPLWAMILALGRMFASDIIQVAKFFGTIFELLFLCSIVHLGYVFTSSRRIGVFWAILIAVNPVYLLTSFSGMELSLYLFLLTLTFIFLARRDHMVCLIFASVAIWARVDGFLIYIISSAFILYALRHVIRKSPMKFFIEFSPSFFIIAGYFLFGLLLYGEIIPASAQVKAHRAPELFSEQWLKGAQELAFQIYNALIGRNTYWYTTDTPYLILIVPFILGIVKTIKSKNTKFLPLLVFTVVYSLSLILSGTFEARNFPWYFVPVLPGIYLLCATGYSWLISIIISRLDISPPESSHKAIMVLSALIWCSLLFQPLLIGSNYLHDVNREREMTYITTIKWLNTVLPEGSVIGTNEIGAIGFYARDDITMLDMPGLVRAKDERFVSDSELYLKYKPAVFLLKHHSGHHKKVDVLMPGEYEWHRVRTLMIGVRRDKTEISDSDFELLKKQFRDNFY